jgi:MFS family permease
MALILTPFGFTVAQISWLGAGGVFAGALSAICFGVFLDKTRAYKKSLVGGSALCLLMAAIFPRLL